MAKVEGFKNKITKAQEDLFKAIETEKAKKKALSEKIVQELSKQDKANVRTLNSLNKEYLEQCNTNQQKLFVFVDTIKKLNDDLQENLDQYQKYCEEHDELAILKEKNDKNLVIAKNKCKREIQDINIKIDRIDKELKDTLETRASDFNEELTTYKSKIIEFDKRRNFEVKKIQDNTIKEYDELQKKLLQENKKSEIKSINKKIKQIRYSGLIEERECIFRYIAEQKQFELDFAKHEYDYKVENVKLSKEYNLKLEDVKFDRSVIEFNFKKNTVMSENDVKHDYNENEKTLKLDHHGQVEDLHKLINERTLEQLAFEYEKADNEAEVTKKIYKAIEENDNKQSVKLDEFINKELALINKDIALFQKNLNFTASFYVQNIINLYTNYFKTYVQKEEIFVNSLLVNSVKGAFLQGNSYDEYVCQIKEIFETFKNNEEHFIESFTSYISMALQNFVDQVESFANTIMLLNHNIIEVIQKHHKDINEVLSTATAKGFIFVENIQNKVKEEVGAREYDNKQLFEMRTKASIEQKNDILNEYNLREKAVKEFEIQKLEEFKVEYSELEKARDNEKQIIESKVSENLSALGLEYDEKVKMIQSKFDEENKLMEKQYKQKMGLL